MKFNYFCRYFFAVNILKKLLLIMKISTFLIFACVATLVANTSYSQSSIVSLNMKNANIRDVFKEIEKQSEYRFFYNEDQVDLSKKVSVLSSKDQLSDILANLFSNTDIAYKVIDKHIVLISTKGYKEALSTNNAQQQKVSGTITDAATGEPLPGVNIVIEGTTVGTVSDFDGKYSIDVPGPDAVLLFSSIGYLTERIMASNQVLIDLKLTPDITKLEEVVVIGYGTRQRKNVVGAVDQIQAKSIEGRPSANLSQALQGTAANLVIQQRSSNPNDNSLNINIRGVSTMNNNEPLVVIDGLITEVESLNKLNPTDIENISVLKDAGSAAIYGSRSANGVILVTTKHGSKNVTPVVKLNAMYGVEKPQVLYSPVKGYENAILKNQALINGGSAPIYTPERIRDLYENGDGEWFLDGILQDAVQQNYNLSISGGTKNSSYMVSAGYFNQESNFVGNFGLERYNFRTNLVNQYGKFKLNTIMAFNRSLQKAPNSSAGTLIVDGGRIPNYYNYKMKGANGLYLINDVLSEFNPLGLLEAGGYQKKDEDNFLGSLNGELEIAKGLKAKALLGIDLSANHRYIRSLEVPFYASETALQPSSFANKTRNTEDYNEKKYTLNTQVMLDFDRTFNNVHNVTGLVGVSNESYTRNANELKKLYTDKDLGLPETGTEVDLKGSYNTPDETQERSIYSMFGRLGYTYNQKYYTQLSFRYDGSSKFADDYRWGFFPSVSLGWRLSEENFLSFYKERIGDLKFRGSYGVLGNQNVDDYSYFTTYTVNTNTYGFNNGAVSGTGFTFGNRELQWETSKNLNVGLDATFLGGKLFVTFDYFNKITSDILLTPEVPTVFGGAVAKDNIGEMKNYGWEFSVNYNATTGNFQHNIGFNLADSQNEVLDFNDDEEIWQSDQMLRITREGLPFRSYYGLKVDGYFQSFDEIANSALPVGTTVVPGDVKYEDFYKDGVIDDKDRQVIGNAFPRYTFGLTYNLTWKGFDFNMLVQGVGQRDMFLRGELIEPFHSNYSYVTYVHQLDFWTPTNTNARWPRLASPGSSSNTNNYQKSSSIYVLDAAYVRLKNIQIGYTLPQNFTKKLGIQSVRVNVNAQNLFTLTKNSFIDPESTEFNGNMKSDGANSGRNYPTLVYFGCGLDVQF